MKSTGTLSGNTAALPGHVELHVVETRTPELVAELTELWERSVRTTHHFLGEEDIERLRGFVPRAIAGIPTLILATDRGIPVGFAGLDSGKIEMLFVDPDLIGLGIGHALMALSVNTFGARLIDVNEHNPTALAIYRHWGFCEYARSETDDQGRPFPILRMSLP